MRNSEAHQITPKEQIFLLFYALICILTPTFTQSAQTREPFKVGLIIDTSYPIGRIALTSIKIAIADFYASNPNSSRQLVVVQRDSSSNVITAASAALELITNESVHAILGPDTAAEVTFVADLGTKSTTPIISYSVASPSVSPNCFPFFVRAAPNDALQVQAIAALVHEYGWHRVVPIYEDDDHDITILPSLVDALDHVEAVIPCRCGIRASATEDHISSELYKLKTLQTRVFVLHACIGLAARILTIADGIGMMSEGYVWILTEGLTNLLGWIGSKSVNSALGVSTRIPDSDRLNDFKRRWTRRFLNENPEADALAVSSDLSSYAVRAYDAVWALALAAERLGPVTNSSTKTGTRKNLLHALSGVHFNGLGGNFQLVGRELNITNARRIINVIDTKAREIGVWSQTRGFERPLRHVIWPGESTVVPKGWELPTSGKRLRLAVPGPVDPGFQSFLNLEVDTATNRTSAMGFVFDMFEAAVRQLPYALLFDYVSVRHAAYNSLMELIANGSYDGIVADMTITAERSKSADFTLPYKQSGIAIVARAVEDKAGNCNWTFIKPLKLTLWLISAAFFIFTGIVVWLMEHRFNKDFRGSVGRQCCTIVSFVFSTLVYAHMEKIVNNFSRVTFIVWLSVVFILTSSYTANLSSMMTVKQLKPSVSDIYELNKSEANVGYLHNSFVKNNLLKLGFSESRLVPLNSPQEYAEALTSGRVAAIVDEIPYLEVFLSNHCDGYQMSGKIFKTGGFGFAFPKGSMLATDLSRAILKITETGESSSIQRKWFNQIQSMCSSEDSRFSSKQLGYDSFKGLFGITGGISGLCCVIALIRFCHENRTELGRIRENNSWRTRLEKVWELFYTTPHPRLLVEVANRVGGSGSGSGSGRVGRVG